MYYIPANTSSNYKWNVFWIKDYAHDNELMISDQKMHDTKFNYHFNTPIAKSRNNSSLPWDLVG